MFHKWAATLHLCIEKRGKKNFGNKDSREVVNVKYPGKFATMVVSKNKEFLFFCFLKSFVFLQKMDTKKQKTKKSENSPNKPIKISNLNRFYANILLRTDFYLVCSMSLSQKN